MRRILFSLPAFALACAASSPNQQLSGTRRAQDDAPTGPRSTNAAHNRRTWRSETPTS